tara:strand:+ start:374 stop:505 length:132 start_codon:yes stop_codon:yes gene_type:complete
MDATCLTSALMVVVVDLVVTAGPWVAILKMNAAEHLETMVVNL